MAAAFGKTAIELRSAMPLPIDMPSHGNKPFTADDRARIHGVIGNKRRELPCRVGDKNRIMPNSAGKESYIIPIAMARIIAGHEAPHVHNLQTKFLRGILEARREGTVLRRFTFKHKHAGPIAGAQPLCKAIGQHVEFGHGVEQIRGACCLPQFDIGVTRVKQDDGLGGDTDGGGHHVLDRQI